MKHYCALFLIVIHSACCGSESAPPFLKLCKKITKKEQATRTRKLFIAQSQDCEPTPLLQRLEEYAKQGEQSVEQAKNDAKKLQQTADLVDKILKEALVHKAKAPEIPCALPCRWQHVFAIGESIGTLLKISQKLEQERAAIASKLLCATDEQEAEAIRKKIASAQIEAQAWGHAEQATIALEMLHLKRTICSIHTTPSTLLSPQQRQREQELTAKKKTLTVAMPPAPLILSYSLELAPSATKT